MSGFSPAWLDLREPFDRVSRDRNVLAACIDYFRDGESINVVDLGAGTGSSLRAFAELLPARQSWLLIDHDQRNLAASEDRLGSWRGSRPIECRTRCLDLASDLEKIDGPVDLITLSALLDLTSSDWIARLADLARMRGAALLATINFDGRIGCEPAHAHDGAIAQDFATHQRRDKGFGVATGPDAARVAAQSLKDRGYTVTMGDSPWLVSDAGPFRDQLVDGIATAVSEIGTLPRGALEDWTAHAKSTARRFIVGHIDLFARP